MEAKRAETLQSVNSVTEPEPLQGDALNKFYVPTDIARDPYFPASSQLQEYIYNSSSPLRLLFASHSGAGKTTELNNLIELSKKDFVVVYFSVREELDIATLTTVDLILVLMENLFRLGLEHELIKDKRAIEPVRKWLSNFLPKDINEKKNADEFDVENDTKVLLEQVISILASMKESFLYSYESAMIVRQEIRPRLAELRNYCNLVVSEIAHNLAKITPVMRLLIVVDDTDKLDVNVAA